MHTNGWGGNYYSGWSGGFGFGLHDWLLGLVAIAAPFIVLLIIWSLFWKGLALWHSARRGQYWWFVIMLVVNTLGILEIIYLFAVAKLHWRNLFSLHEPHHHE